MIKMSFALVFYFAIILNFFACGEVKRKGDGGSVPGNEVGQSDFSGIMPGGSGSSGDLSAGSAAGGTTGGAAEESAPTANKAGDDGGTAAAPRDVEEGNIYSVYQDRYLINLNSYRGLQVIDVKNPAKPVLLSQNRFMGYPLEMYFKDKKAYVLLRNALEYKVKSNLKIDRYQGAALKVIDLSNVNNPKTLVTFKIEGNILSSRRVGEVLYIVSNKYTYKNGVRYTDSNNTYVESFKLDPKLGAKAVDQKKFAFYSREIQGFPTALLIAQNKSYDSTINYLDISDPNGKIKVRGSVKVEGRVQKKFNLDLYKNQVRIVTNGWENGGSNWKTRGQRMNFLNIFDFSNPDKPKHLSVLKFAKNESLFATLFDGERGFFVTYRRVDPLFAIDMKDPKKPIIASELKITGWNNFFKITHNGTRLVGIGVDDADRTRRMAVSLFDISDIYHTKMLGRTHLSTGYSSSNANWDDKAFSVIEKEGLILVPYRGYDKTSRKYFSGIRIVELRKDAVVARGKFQHPGTVQRTFTVNKDVANLSQEELGLLDIADKDNPKLKGSLELAPNVSDFYTFGKYGVKKVIKYQTSSRKGSVTLRTVALSGTATDKAKPLNEFKIESQGRMIKNGDQLIDINQVYDSKARKYKTTVTVYDFSDPLSPKKLGTATADTYFRTFYSYRGGRYYGQPLASSGGAVAEGGTTTEDAVSSNSASEEPSSAGASSGMSRPASDMAEGVACDNGPYGCGNPSYNNLSTLKVKDGLVFYSFTQKAIKSGTEKRCSKRHDGSERCYTYTKYKYTYDAGLHFLDLKDPKKPNFDKDFHFDRAFSSLVSDGKRIFFSYRDNFKTVGKTLQYKSYYKMVDFSGSKTQVGNKINIPGELVKVDGSNVFTTEYRYNTADWSQNMAAYYLTELHGKAYLKGSRAFTGRNFYQSHVDNKNNFFVASTYTYQQKKKLYGNKYYQNPESSKIHLEVFDFDTKGVDRLSKIELESWANLQTVIDDRVFLRVTGGYLLFDYQNPSKPKAQDFFPVMGYNQNIVVDQDDLYIPAGRYGLFSFDLNSYPIIAIP